MLGLIQSWVVTLTQIDGPGVSVHIMLMFPSLRWVGSVCCTLQTRLQDVGLVFRFRCSYWYGLLSYVLAGIASVYGRNMGDSLAKIGGKLMQNIYFCSSCGPYLRYLYRMHPVSSCVTYGCVSNDPCRQQPGTEHSYCPSY